MRRLTGAALAAALLLGAGCRSHRREREVQIDDGDGGELMSVVKMGEPRSAVQLVKGFHQPEGGWRWTQGRFTIALKVPPGAGKGGVFTLQATLPNVLIDNVKSTTLSCSVGGAALEPETFSAVGEYFHKRDVPAAALAGESASFECSLSKFIASGQIEERELGLIATTASLTAK